eukprot:TRINITY_DN2473_c1_g1_i3.p2 TRINITY_DN2473_c1_g1~~TRINITY_DN2473_c1_g1_i3.p2  ORF type:complete len:258 (-),score=91.42 TRINITY_DN2473_c1_g1_i3:134-907(-)
MRALLLLVVLACSSCYADENVFGPLAMLEGTWFGNSGRSVSPAPPIDTCFTETITFTRMFPVANDVAGNTLYALHYEQYAYDPTGNPLHHEVGEWLWDPATKTVVRIAAVPRGQAVLAGGVATLNGDGSTVLTVEAQRGNDSFGILNTPAALAAAPAVRYQSVFTLDKSGALLTYVDTTTLALVQQGNAPFTHVNADCLHKQTQPTGGTLVPLKCPYLPTLCTTTATRDDDDVDDAAGTQVRDARAARGLLALMVLL